MASTLLNYNVQIFFLVFARVFAMLEITPVVANAGMSFMARAGLSFFICMVVTPVVVTTGYLLPTNTLAYALLLLTEVLIGLLMGFLLVLIFAVMTSAGQMFSLQMGFGATEAFDPTTQVEAPILSQLLNLAGIMVFLSSFGLQKLLFLGITGSFQYVNASNLVFNIDGLTQFFSKGLITLIGQALLIAMPIMGSLFLINVTMGLLSKAAPQMNLMMVGFPIQIMVGFIIFFIALPNMLGAFEGMIDNLWYSLDNLVNLLRPIK